MVLAQVLLTPCHAQPLPPRCSRILGSTAQALSWDPSSHLPLQLLTTSEERTVGGKGYDAHFPDEEMEAQRG